MASSLVSIAGWYFLPKLVTGYVQVALYSIFIRAGDPKPVPGSPRFARDRRLIQITVIVLYLIYTVYEADYQLQTGGDFYSLLGVPHDVDEKALQSKFRRLTVQYHPDKVPAEQQPAMEALYFKLQQARDTLVEPALRFAYDRFGPDVLSWQNCKVMGDFINTGLQSLAVYYVGTASVLVLLGTVGYLRQGVFWRYLVMASLFVIELHVVTLQDFPVVLNKLVNPFLLSTGLRRVYLPYQMIILLRKLTVTFFIAMTQLGPLLQDRIQAATERDGREISEKHLDRIDALTQATDQEISRLIGFELMPFLTERVAARELRGTLKEWLVQNSVRNDPEVKAAVGRILDRERREGESSEGIPAS